MSTGQKSAAEEAEHEQIDARINAVRARMMSTDLNGERIRVMSMTRKQFNDFANSICAEIMRDLKGDEDEQGYLVEYEKTGPGRWMIVNTNNDKFYNWQSDSKFVKPISHAATTQEELSALTTQIKRAMQQYFNVSIVQAYPMTRGEYNEFVELESMKDRGGKDSDSGYLVEYPVSKDTQPNLGGFDGWTSWLPSKAFESRWCTDVSSAFRLEQARAPAESVDLSAMSTADADKFERVHSQLQSRDFIHIHLGETVTDLEEFRAKHFPDLDPDNVREIIAKNSVYYAKQMAELVPRTQNNRSMYKWNNGLSLILDDGPTPLFEGMQRNGGQRIFCSLKVNNYETYYLKTADELFLLLTRYNTDL